MQRVRPYGMTAEDAASKSQGVLSSFRWAAKRMGCGLTGLKLAFPLYGSVEGLTGESPLVGPISTAADLRGLRCLEYISEHWQGTEAHASELVDWLLQSTPKLEALSLDVRSTHLAARSITFQHLKHLVMPSSNLFEGHSNVFRAAELLPALGTLCITGSNYGKGELPSLDLVGCRHLRQLALSEGVPVQELLKGPGCKLCVDVGDDGEPGSLYEMQAALADQFVMEIVNITLGHRDAPGFGLCPSASTIHVHCTAACSIDGKAIEHFRAVPILHKYCMPANGQPVRNLRVLTMKAHRFKDCIPAGLPNLEELVISAGSSLELSFEDVTSTFSVLTRFYAFGKPLMPDEQDMIRLMSSDVLSSRGMVLRFSSVKADEKDSSCMYLQPTAAKGESTEKLHDVVEQLVQCRCSACFDCLRRSGCLDY